MPKDNKYIENSSQILIPSSLANARIWLSGSVPETELTTEAQRIAIIDFVKKFSRRVFERGGHIIHGSHPSFTEILIEEAKRHIENGGRKDCLNLVVSRYWSKNTENSSLSEWQKVAIVHEIPELLGERSRDESLDLLRKWMASRCDAMVSVGGKFWKSVGGRSGVPLEMKFAIERGIPCFLLGGLGGAAKAFFELHPEILTQLKNGLTTLANHNLSTKEDVGSLAEEVCNQLERLPLVRGQGSDGVSFRILALDGGGLKGTFTASVLATWEKHTNLNIVNHFDLIAGTSTGGILAIGLGLGFSGQELLDFYLNHGPLIFPLTRFQSRIKHSFRHIFKSKYSQEILLKELRATFNRDNSPAYLKDSRCRLVIPTYHAVAGASHLFRTPHHQDLTFDANTEAAVAALATSAAPTFFNAAKIANIVAESSYFDGGVWANSPVMAAIIEAVCFLKIPLERIDVLSVGTTEEPFSVRKQVKSGIIGWLWKKKLIDLLMNVQQESSLKLAQHLVGIPRFFRVNEITSPGTYSLDGTKEIKELAGLGNHCALKTEILTQVKSRFLNNVPVAPWQSYP